MTTTKHDHDWLRAETEQADMRFGAECVIDLAGADGEGDERRPTFSMVAYTGGMLNVGYGSPVVVELAGIRNLGSNRPVFLGHSPDVEDILGQTTSIKIEAGQLIAAGKLLPGSTRGDRVIALAKSGFAWQASIGGKIVRREFVEAGKSVRVNGQTFQGPVIVARELDLKEISIVALGADAKTSTRIAAQNQNEENTMDFYAWLESRGFKAEDLSEQQLDTLKAAWKAETEQAAGEPGGSGETGEAGDGVRAGTNTQSTDDLLAEYRQQVAAEQDRIHAIRSIEGAEEQADIVAQAIRDGWSTEKAELAIMRASRPQAPAAHTGRGRSEVNEAQAIEASIAMTAGLSETEAAEGIDERAMSAAVSREYRGLSLHGLIYACLAAVGGFPRRGGVDDETIEAAFNADRDLRATGGFSTVSLTGILGNVANKHMLSAFRAIASIVPQVTASRSVQDFKQNTHYRLTADGAFQEVGENGELKHISLQEGSFTNQASTRGGIMTLTRRMLINDDLGAFLAIPRLFGRQGAIAREKAVAIKVIDNDGDFFASGNNNYTSGSTTNLSIAGLSTGEQLFLDQTDANGDPIMVTPATLLVPTSLKVTAERLMGSLQLTEGGGSSESDVPTDNPHAGKFQTAASPYLNNSSITGYSAKAWYLFADPNDVPAIVVSYLRGRNAPVIERGQTNFDTLGVSWRGYFDFGVDYGDEQGAVKVKGEA